MPLLDFQLRKTLTLDNGYCRDVGLTMHSNYIDIRNKKELNGFIKQLSKWNVEIVQINQDISARAMIYIETSHSMELADALIAATCVSGSELLLTANEKHYKHIPNIQIKKFIP